MYSFCGHCRRKREAIARLFTIDDPNPTLNTIIELLTALHLTADITLRQSEEAEGPIKIYIATTGENAGAETKMEANPKNPSPSGI